MGSLYRFLRSVRLAVVLILVIIVLSILATLVPQGRNESYYLGIYPEGLTRLILALGFNNFFRSILFLAPAALFVANLGTCTVYRLVTRARTGAARRYGPDLVHIALLVLVVGGITTTLARREKYFTMGVGDAVEISGGYRVELLDFQYQTYDSGRPKDWVSTVKVSREGATLLESYDIEVNRPLRLGLLRVYQTSFDTDGALYLVDGQGVVSELGRGYGVSVGSITMRYFLGFETSGQGGHVAVFQDYHGEIPGAVSRAAEGESLGDYRIQTIHARDLTGLTAARDPGYIPVLIALVLGAAGMTLTFAQRKGEANP